MQSHDSFNIFSVCVVISRVMAAQIVTDPPCPSVLSLFDSHSKVEESVTAFIRVSGSFAVSLGLTFMRKNCAHVPETQTISHFQCDLFFAQSFQYLGTRTNAGTCNPVSVLTGEYLYGKFH